MLYPQEFIEDLKQRADIARVVEGYGLPLKKKGQNWWAPCPFHSEKTASFSVNAGKGMFKCFGCGKGGNVFTFVMEYENLTFPEAVRAVAEKEGVPLPAMVGDGDLEQSKKASEERKRIVAEVVQLNEWATEFWQAQLQENNSAAKAAREYLEKRGLTEETQNTFRLGYAPDSWDALNSYLIHEKGAGESQLELAGLVKRGEAKNNVYDRFRGRVIFPVLDVNGKAVAFGGRIMDTGEPKYLNSPETPAYIKGKHLYGLYQARNEIRKRGYAILVEGYLDLLTPFQNGVKNCVASLGTACTDDQARLLHRFARRVVINYDGDSAGVKAARRAIETLLAEDFEIKVLVLPNGADPDDFIRSQGVKAYHINRGKAFPHLKFVLEQAVRDRNLRDARQKSEAIEEIIPVLCAVKNNLQQRESFDQTMSFFQVEDAELKNDLWKSVQRGAAGHKDAKRQIARLARPLVTLAEQQLLAMLLSDAEIRRQTLPLMEESDYGSLATASAFRSLLEMSKQDLAITPESLLAFMGEDDPGLDMIPDALASAPQESNAENAQKRILALRAISVDRHMVEVRENILRAQENEDSEALQALVQEQLRLGQMKRSLEPAALFADAN
jgi:DNA primase